MTTSEGVVLAAVTAMGLATLREILRIQRWDRGFFVRGLTVYRQSSTVPSAQVDLPLPAEERHLLSAAQVRARRISPTEVLFLAPALTWAAMRGWLCYRPDVGQVEARGQLNWAGLALLSCIAFADYRLGPAALLLFGIAYVAERRRFSRILEEVVRGMRA